MWSFLSVIFNMDQKRMIMFECLITLAGLIWPIFSVNHHMPYKNTNDTVNTGDRELSQKTNSAEGKRSQLKMFYKAFFNTNYVIHIRGYTHISYITLKGMETSLFE